MAWLSVIQAVAVFIGYLRHPEDSNSTMLKCSWATRVQTRQLEAEDYNPSKWESGKSTFSILTAVYYQKKYLKNNLHL